MAEIWVCDQTTRAWLFIVLAVPQQHSHPIPTHPCSGSWSTQEAGGSSVRNGSCLGLATKPFALVCSLAWSVQASVISRADTGGWVSQQQAVGAVRISPSKWELCPPTPAGRVLTSVCSTLCQIFVPVLSFFCCSFTVPIKGLQGEAFWRKPDLYVQQVWKGTLTTLSYCPFVLTTQDMLQIMLFRVKGEGLLLGCCQKMFSNFCS